MKEEVGQQKEREGEEVPSALREEFQWGRYLLFVFSHVIYDMTLWMLLMKTTI